MKRTIASLAIGLLSSICDAQQDFNRYQPYTPAYTPTVVGGLPPGSRGLEQPVFVADRAAPNQPMEAAEYSTPEYLSANGLGLDESKMVPTTNKLDRFEAGMLIAVVGEEHILIGDLIPANKLTAKLLGHSQFEMQLRKVLMESVTRKALAAKFLNDKVSGKPVKDREDAKKQMKTQTAKMFHQRWVPEQMKAMKCQSALEFESKLAEDGKTLQSLMREVAEKMWAQEHIREKIQENPIIELSELKDYYEEHVDDFKRPARARFQMISADFSKYPTKQEAYRAIEDMFNQIVYGGAPFGAVAKRHSTGLAAAEGGLFDWTTQGALKSKDIDRVIFTNPVRGLSQVIETSDGFHVVEVLEREQAYTQSFAQAQAEIRKKLVEQKVSKQRIDFIKKVREETPIWTKWPEDIPGSQDISLLQQ